MISRSGGCSLLDELTHWHDTLSLYLQTLHAFHNPGVHYNVQLDLLEPAIKTLSVGTCGADHKYCTAVNTVGWVSVEQALPYITALRPGCCLSQLPEAECSVPQPLLPNVKALMSGLIHLLIFLLGLPTLKIPLLAGCSETRKPLKDHRRYKPLICFLCGLP